MPLHRCKKLERSYIMQEVIFSILTILFLHELHLVLHELNEMLKR